MSVRNLPRRLFLPGVVPGDQSVGDWLDGLVAANAKHGFTGPAVLVTVDHEGDIVLASTTGDLAKMNTYLDIAKQAILSIATGDYGDDE
jgi:hypothetical protein